MGKTKAATLLLTAGNIWCSFSKQMQDQLLQLLSDGPLSITYLLRRIWNGSGEDLCVQPSFCGSPAAWE